MARPRKKRKYRTKTKVLRRPKHNRLRASLRSMAKMPTFDEMDYIMVEEAMRRFWLKGDAALALGISREGFRKKVNRLRLNWWQQ